MVVNWTAARRARVLTGAAAVCVLLATPAPAPGDRVPLHMVPRAVIDAVRARFADARIAGVEKERHEGRVLYEVALRDGGQRIDVFVTPEGGLLWIKTAIEPGALPPAVASALEARYPGAVYQEAEEVRAVQGGREALAGYEVVLLTAAKVMVETQVGPDGRALARAWR